MIKRIAILGVLMASAAIVMFPLPASAQPPTSMQVLVNDVEVFRGADSPCPFETSVRQALKIVCTSAPWMLCRIGVPVLS